MLAEEIIKFAEIVGKLKKLPRTGWKRVGIKNPESVAEHLYRQALLCMIIGDERKLDTEKMIRMALLDDLHEAIIGDLTPEEQKKLGEEKYKENERKGTIKTLEVLANNLKEKYLKLWDELIELKSEEAKLVKQIDKLEMAIQAYENEKETGKDLTEFLEFAKSKIKDPKLINIINYIEKLRR